MLAAMPAATRAKMAAGVSWGNPIIPGTDVVMATAMPITKAPNSIKPMPPARNWLRSPEKMRAARDISLLMVLIATITPAVRLGNKIFGRNSSLKAWKFIWPLMRLKIGNPH